MHLSSRAFTLLEVVLATSMGAMVIVVALALMQSMERLEKPLGVRQQELADLHRARLVMQRAIAGLVMSDTPAPVNPNARRNSNQTTTGDEAAKSAFEAAEEQFKSRNPRPPARLLLEPDTSAELRAMLIDVGLPADEAQKLQRLEVVIDSPPIAPQFRAELVDAMAANATALSATTASSGSSTSGDASTTGLSRAAAARSQRSASLRERFGAASARIEGDTSTAASGLAAGLDSGLSSGSGDASATSGSGRGSRMSDRAAALLGGGDSAKQGALRGCFEIRPMLTADAALARAEGKPVLYELWWRPMPAAVEVQRRASSPGTSLSSQPDNPETEGTPKITDPRQLYAWGEPVLLADNLVKCNWQLYSEGQRRRAHHAVWEKELPAYVEFEIQTKTGLYANWMFEIGWTKGPELAARTGPGGGPASGALNPAALDPEGRGNSTGAPGGIDNSGTAPTGVTPTTTGSGNGVDTIDIRKKP
ncbi:MAG TPA: hypothetical protein VF777_15350 [Phycisphaerales bacterium]